MLLKKEADGRAASLPNLCWGTWWLLCDCQTAMINDWRELEFTDCPSNFSSLKILIKYLKDTVKPVSANLQLTFIDKGAALLLGWQGEKFELRRWMVDAMSFFLVVCFFLMCSWITEKLAQFTIVISEWQAVFTQYNLNTTQCLDRCMRHSQVQRRTYSKCAWFYDSPSRQIHS